MYMVTFFLKMLRIIDVPKRLCLIKGIIMILRFRIFNISYMRSSLDFTSQYKEFKHINFSLYSSLYCYTLTLDIFLTLTISLHNERLTFKIPRAPHNLNPILQQLPMKTFYRQIPKVKSRTIWNIFSNLLSYSKKVIYVEVQSITIGSSKY